MGLIREKVIVGIPSTATKNRKNRKNRKKKRVKRVLPHNSGSQKRRKTPPREKTNIWTKPRAPGFTNPC